MKELKPLMQVGAQFTMSSCNFEVVNVSENEIRFTPMEGGATKTSDVSTLRELFSTGRIQLDYTPPSASDPFDAVQRSGLSEGQLESLKRKLRYVWGVIRSTSNPGSQQEIKKAIPSVAKEINDQDPPGVSTVAGWIKQWLDGGRQDAALMPQLKPSRVRHGLDPKVHELVMESAQAIYMNRQRNSMNAVHADVLLRITQCNQSSRVPLSMPSKETIRKIVQRIDLFQRDKARQGPRYAERKHRAVGRGFTTVEPLELAMADGQVMDIILIDEHGEDIGRPFLTVIIDVYSRCVLATYVSLAPFSGATLLKAIGRAVVAKKDEPRGIMVKLVVDNGADYRHAGFVRFCSRLDIAIEPCPPRTPNGKAIVERFFRTLNEDLIHKFPGTTFSSPTDRGDYDSQRLARMTIDDVRKHVDVWIREVYHLRVHRSLLAAPWDVWSEAVSDE